VNYAVKETYLTVQGEGANAGRVAVFCRFAGCNLWSGLEADRHRAICGFCDTDFRGVDGPGGGLFGSAEDLCDAIRSKWPRAVPPGRPLVVFTGGEPLLQLDAALVRAMGSDGFEVAVETNGTIRPPDGLDWITVSPKAGAELVLKSGQELKLVFPQVGIAPKEFEDLQFGHFFLQPMDGPARQTNTDLAIKYCLEHPRWRLSVQVHKLVGIP